MADDEDGNLDDVGLSPPAAPPPLPDGGAGITSTSTSSSTTGLQDVDAYLNDQNLGATSNPAAAAPGDPSVRAGLGVPPTTTQARTRPPPVDDADPWAIDGSDTNLLPVAPNGGANANHRAADDTAAHHHQQSNPNLPPNADESLNRLRTSTTRLTSTLFTKTSELDNKYQVRSTVSNSVRNLDSSLNVSGTVSGLWSSLSGVVGAVAGSANLPGADPSSSDDRSAGRDDDTAEAAQQPNLLGQEIRQVGRDVTGQVSRAVGEGVRLTEPARRELGARLGDLTESVKQMDADGGWGVVAGTADVLASGADLLTMSIAGGGGTPGGGDENLEDLLTEEEEGRVGEEDKEEEEEDAKTTEVVQDQSS